jgi:phage-related protein (TIGR01555 family)
MSLGDMFRLDGWKNVLAGLGKKGRDKTESTYFSGFEILDDRMLTEMYIQEGLGTRIIDSVARDMVSSGWTISNDEKNLIQEETRDLKVQKKLMQALVFARLYRGSIVVLITERGDLEKPLGQNSGRIKSLKVYSATRIELISSDIVSDPNSKYFEDIEVFNIRLRNGDIMKVHTSRCLVFKGKPAPDYFGAGIDLQYQYWGFSALQRVWERLKNYGAVEKGIANLMLEFIIGKYTIHNLEEILSQNSDEAVKAIYNRMDIIDASKSIINAVMLGENEKYERDSANVSGVGDIIDRFMMNLCAVCEIPVTKLFMRSPAGMNATGEFDLINYYDLLTDEQEDILMEPVQRITDIIAGYVYPGTTEKYMVEFNPLWEPKQKEVAEIEDIYSRAYTAYVNMGALLPEEVRILRFPELDDTGEGMEPVEEEE